MFSINGDSWLIFFVPWDSPHLRRKDGSYALGSCDNRRNIIYIREDLGSKYTRKVICHELVHAAMDSYGIQLEERTEELLADLFATFGKEIMELSDNVGKSY